MIEVGALLDELTESGVSAVTGVPCSYLSALINRVASSAAVAYLPVAHEADAIALAAGS
jgi:phosphonopyruvate decarboxylase